MRHERCSSSSPWFNCFFQIHLIYLHSKSHVYACYSWCDTICHNVFEIDLPVFIRSPFCSHFLGRPWLTHLKRDRPWWHAWTCCLREETEENMVERIWAKTHQINEVVDLKNGFVFFLLLLLFFFFFLSCLLGGYDPLWIIFSIVVDVSRLEIIRVRFEKPHGILFKCIQQLQYFTLGPNVETLCFPDYLQCLATFDSGFPRLDKNHESLIHFHHSKQGFIHCIPWDW